MARLASESDFEKKQKMISTTYNVVRLSSPLGGSMEESKEDKEEPQQLQGRLSSPEKFFFSSLTTTTSTGEEAVTTPVGGTPRSSRSLYRVPAAKRARVEIGKLAKSATAAEVRASLRRVLEALENCDARGLVEVRPFLDAAVPEHQKQLEAGKERSSTSRSMNAAAWTRENRAFFVSMLLTYYKGDRLSMLPKDVVCGCVLSFCDIALLAKLTSVSRATRNVADSDAAWRSAYERAFGGSKAGVTYDYGASLKESYHQRIRDPTVGDRVEVAWQGRFRLEGLEVYRGLAWWAAEVAEKRADSDSDSESNASGFDDEDMMADDQEGEDDRGVREVNGDVDAAAATGEDQVGGGGTTTQANDDEFEAPVAQQEEAPTTNNEAAGAAPLPREEDEETAETGVVGRQRRRRRRIDGESMSEAQTRRRRRHRRKASTQRRRYKVHYLNWDARWDEWVSRDQLRWPVQEGKTCAIETGDDVEVWCSGNTVPGAWLRAVVDEVDEELFCVGNVASSGHLWVSRDRVRLVRRKAANGDDKNDAKKRSRLLLMGSRLPNCLAGPAQKLKEAWSNKTQGLRLWLDNAIGCVLAPVRLHRNTAQSTTYAPEEPQPPFSPAEPLGGDLAFGTGGGSDDIINNNNNDGEHQEEEDDDPDTPHSDAPLRQENEEHHSRERHHLGAFVL